jgi:hypothetical protein
MRELLENHCYVQTIKYAYVNLAKYQYVLTNNKVKFGDPRTLMPALYGKAAPVKALKTNAKELDMESQTQWPRFWSALQDYSAEVVEVENAGGYKEIRPLTEDEIFDIVLEKVREAFPRINTPHLNSKGTKEELRNHRKGSRSPPNPS